MLHCATGFVGMDAGRNFEKTIEESTVPIRPGDVFVFYTDGISESMNVQGEEFGEERLCALIDANAREEAQSLLEKITAEVNSFSNGAKQHDDFTMVVVKVEG
ncbi:serine/threonine-protein phosphatase, partial [candidate division KSB1 bacterium]|nr:serine/threonine-protein phosphatase [candidate division KSB1 bacterium]